MREDPERVGDDGVEHLVGDRLGSDARGERIEHDARNDRTEFFGKARVRSGGDDVCGNYITFDGLTERYLVTGAASGASGPNTTPPVDTRVRATLQPKKETSKEINNDLVPNPAR